MRKGWLVPCLGLVLTSVTVAETPHFSTSEGCAMLAASPFEPGFENQPQRIVDLPRAVEECEAAHVTNPQAADVAAWLGRAQMEAFNGGEATHALEVALSGGHKVGTALYATLLLDRRHTPEEATRAVALLRPLTDEGLALAQYGLGRAYDFGYGVEADPDRAAAYYRLAADQGYSRAQAALSSIYELGLGVDQDDGQALRWAKEAASQNDPYGIWQLARLYESGIGVEQDRVQARALFQRGADLGDPLAINQLGHIYAEGLGTNRDEARAVALFARAAAMGEPLAIGNLGHMYLLGKGVTADPEYAAVLSAGGGGIG